MSPIPDDAQTTSSRNVLECIVLSSAAEGKAPRAPRSTAQLAESYQNSQGLQEADIWDANSFDGASEDAFRWVADALQCHPHATTSAWVDRYLADAILRWLLARTRTQPARRTYLYEMKRWLLWEPRGVHRRSLERQTATLAADVNAWLRYLEDSADYGVRSIVKTREILRSWFGWLLELDLIQRLPLNRESLKAWRIRPERVQRGDGTRQALTHAEAQGLAKWALHASQPVAGFAALLQAIGGLRSHEVACAERRHLVEFNGTWRLSVQGKGNKQRLVTLEPVIIAAWNRYQKEGRHSGQRGWLLNHRAKRYSEKTVQGWAKQGLATVGRADLSSHDLRRTAVTLLVEQGATIDQAKVLLGHSDIRLTERCYVMRPKPLSVTTGISAEEIP